MASLNLHMLSSHGYHSAWSRLHLLRTVQPRLSRRAHSAQHAEAAPLQDSHGSHEHRTRLAAAHGGEVDVDGDGVGAATIEATGNVLQARAAMARDSGACASAIKAPREEGGQVWGDRLGEGDVE